MKRVFIDVIDYEETRLVIFGTWMEVSHL